MPSVGALKSEAERIRHHFEETSAVLEGLSRIVRDLCSVVEDLERKVNGKAPGDKSSSGSTSGSSSGESAVRDPSAGKPGLRKPPTA